MPSRPSPVRCKLGEQDGPCQQHQFFVSSCALFTFAIPRAFLCTHKGRFASSLFVVVVVVVVSLSLPPPHTHCPPHSVLGTPGHRVDASQPRHSTRADSAALSATHSQLAARARPRASLDNSNSSLVSPFCLLLAPCLPTRPPVRRGSLPPPPTTTTIITFYLLPVYHSLPALFLIFLCAQAWTHHPRPSPRHSLALL